jgi:hypothetical protein
MQRVYAQRLNPSEHPDYHRRPVQPPGWDTFGGRTRFTTLRGFAVEDGRVVGYAEELQRHVEHFDLGDVIWPSYSILFAANLDELAAEIHRRDLFLFDIWGYVPGSGPEGYWQQFRPPEGVFEQLEGQLGERWLGMDVGEQDGRYIGGYASQMHPISTDRVEQYLNFQRHFERMCNDLGNRMSTLVSLNFGHHLIKEGVYTAIGAETAQGLPNGQVYYAFIRGAGKQYGVPWFGNASVWNRWGWKTYESEGADHGPDKGTSLSLLKRLLYSHVLYNCVLAGFENSWLEGDKLSPVGRIQQAAHRWVREHPDPGVMVTPVALMIDFFAGWSFPRHLYSGHAYRAWGNVPYGPGDYLSDGVLDLLYPGYQDSSFYHDESGFVTPTPYGDCADVLLTDAAAWLLARYPVLVVAGEISGDLELGDKLAAYVAQGGQLVLTAGNLTRWPDGLAGVRAGSAVVVEPGATVVLDGARVTEEQPFELHELLLGEMAPDGSEVTAGGARQRGTVRVLAECAGKPAAVQVRYGNGTVTILAAPFGIPSCPAVADGLPNQLDAPLPKPFPLLRHVGAVLDAVLRTQVLFEAGDGLSVITCRRGAGQYTLGVANNGLTGLPFNVISLCGPIQSIEELRLDESEKCARGYLPTLLEGTDVGTTCTGCEGGASPGGASAGTLAGGDLRILRVTVEEEAVVEIPHVAPPPRSRGRGLPLRGMRSIQEEVLRRPTFFQHFDAAAVDWRYLAARDKQQLTIEAGWISRQGLRLYVDLTSGINLYPDLRLVDNVALDYAASRAVIQDVLRKMEVLGARDLILSLHRVPENNITAAETWAAFGRTLRQISAEAAAADITMYLRPCLKYRCLLVDMADLVRRVAAPNLRLAASTALLLDEGIASEALRTALGDALGLWLASAAAYDLAGSLWTANAPVASVAGPALDDLLAAAPGVPVLLDAVYASWDEEYLDVRALKHGRGPSR